MFNSVSYGSITFSSASPNILVLKDDYLVNASLVAQNILKSGTGFYCVENCTYAYSTSTFSGTRLFNQALTFENNSIDLNKLKNGTPDKIL
jgi:hypothetical protein